MVFYFLISVPKAKRHFVVTPQEPNLYKIALAKPSKRLSNIDELPQELELRDDLTVLQKYTKTQGKRAYPVHRWPDAMTRELNRFLYVHTMSEGELYDFSGLSPINFW